MHTFFIQQIESQLPEGRVFALPFDFRYKVLAIRSSMLPNTPQPGDVINFTELLNIINNGFKVIVTPYRKSPSYFEAEKMLNRELHVAPGYEARESSVQGKFEILPKLSYRDYCNSGDVVFGASDDGLAMLPPYVDYVGLSELIRRESLHEAAEKMLADALKESREPEENIVVHHIDAR